ETLVALEPHPLPAARLRAHLRELRLPAPGRPFDEDRLLQPARQIDDRRDGAASDVALVGEALDDVVDAGEHARDPPRTLTQGFRRRQPRAFRAPHQATQTLWHRAGRSGCKAKPRTRGWRTETVTGW